MQGKCITVLMAIVFWLLAGICIYLYAVNF